jgi:Xaa-Pro aminopeptidase
MRYTDYRLAEDRTKVYRHYPIEKAFPLDEYRLRIERARTLMTSSGMDALVITSSAIGRWFTGALEPHSWHDRVPSRSTWYILTPDADYLYITPTNNHNLASSRRMTWVSEVREVVERTEWPRVEIWGINQVTEIFAELGLENSRLGFELGDTMTLGISFNDFLALKDLLPSASLVDASPVIRRLMAIQTPFEIECVRKACRAGQWIHERVAEVLRVGMTERALFHQLADLFRGKFGRGYAYAPNGGWDVRNQRENDYNLYHTPATDRPYRDGDHLCRGTSGASYAGYPGDIDRAWYLGSPPDVVVESYRKAWECNRAMAEAIKPGARCSDVYMAGVPIEVKFGGPQGRSGRRGHGLYNTGGLSVHPDNHTVLQPGMILSVEPMFGNDYGFFDLEDQFVVTETGAECLHDPAPENLTCIPIR